LARLGDGGEDEAEAEEMSFRFAIALVSLLCGCASTSKTPTCPIHGTLLKQRTLYMYMEDRRCVEKKVNICKECLTEGKMPPKGAR
jgi:hypothetical protein